MKVNVKMSIEGLKFIIPTNADVNLDKFDFNIDDEMSDGEFMNMIKGFKELAEEIIKGEKKKESASTPQVITPEMKKEFSAKPIAYHAKTLDNTNSPISEALNRVQQMKVTSEEYLNKSDELWEKMDEIITGWRKETIEGPAGSSVYEIKGTYPEKSILCKTDKDTESIIIARGYRRRRRDDLADGIICRTEIRYTGKDCNENFGYRLDIYPASGEIERLKTDKSDLYSHIHDESLKLIATKLVEAMDDVEIGK